MFPYFRPLTGTARTPLSDWRTSGKGSRARARLPAGRGKQEQEWEKLMADIVSYESENNQPKN